MFRKQGKQGQKWPDAFTEKVRHTLERYFELAEILNAKQTFKNPLIRSSVSSEADAEVESRIQKWRK